MYYVYHITEYFDFILRGRFNCEFSAKRFISLSNEENFIITNKLRSSETNDQRE